MTTRRPDVDEMQRMGFFGKAWLALRAMYALAKNIVDPWGQQAFQWALDGWGIGRVARRAKHSELGRHLLETRPLLAIDLERYAQYPEGTLGHFLAQWFRAWKLEPFPARRVPQSDLEYFVDRLYFTHDVWHALCGLGTDLRNELRFLAVLLSQYASGSGLMALVLGWLRVPFNDGVVAFLTMPYEAFRFYRWGQRSMDLCFVPWEALLDQPLEAVRAQFLAADRPRIGEWQTWPTPRIVLPPKLEAEAGVMGDTAVSTS
ncbi:MAG: Coq4 family protein [Myxococcaceae bacterium]|jgi:ubiquinone biosynthesis protein Coq4|nr:Coq4 family protein [Myxococcaceae bacterium]